MKSAEGRKLGALLAPFAQPRDAKPSVAEPPKALRDKSRAVTAPQTSAAAQESADEEEADDAWQEVPTLRWEDAQRRRS